MIHTRIALLTLHIRLLQWTMRATDAAHQWVMHHASRAFIGAISARNLAKDRAELESPNGCAGDEIAGLLGVVGFGFATGMVIADVWLAIEGRSLIALAWGPR